MIIINVFILVQNTTVTEPTFQANSLVSVSCPHCHWSGEYPTEGRAAQGLGRHSGHCKGQMVIKAPRKPAPEPLILQVPSDPELNQFMERIFRP